MNSTDEERMAENILRKWGYATHRKKNCSRFMKGKYYIATNDLFKESNDEKIGFDVMGINIKRIRLIQVTHGGGHPDVEFRRFWYMVRNPILSCERWFYEGNGTFRVYSFDGDVHESVIKRGIETAEILMRKKKLK